MALHCTYCTVHSLVLQKPHEPKCLNFCIECSNAQNLNLKPYIYSSLKIVKTDVIYVLVWCKEVSQCALYSNTVMHKITVS